MCKTYGRCMCVVLCGMGTGNTGLGLQVEYPTRYKNSEEPVNCAGVQAHKYIWFFSIYTLGFELVEKTRIWNRDA